MILIAVVGLGFVVGMPYLMDSSMFWFSLSRSPSSTMTMMTDILVHRSGSRDEEGIRRATEEEYIEWWNKHGKSVAELRHGRLDGCKDVWEKCGDKR